VIAAFFYLRLIVVMYMTDPVEGQADVDAADAPGRRPFELDPATALALGLAVAATVVMGVLPGAFIDFARDATLLF
jgi:NADH-quinone oxidoreductase subunit N